MRKPLLLLVPPVLLGALLLAAGPTACFEPQLPTVAFECGEADACPPDYECRSDGCCHKIGSPLDEHGPCAPAADAAVDAMVSLDASP